MRVIAIAPGYDGVMYRDPDAFEDGKPVVFDMPDGSRGKWFVEVDEEGRPLAPVAPKKKADKNAPPPGAGPKKGSQLDVAGASKQAADVNSNPLA